MKEVKQGIYSTGHSNKQEKERGRQGGQVYTKEAEHTCQMNYAWFLLYLQLQKLLS